MQLTKQYPPICKKDIYMSCILINQITNIQNCNGNIVQKFEY